MLLSRLLVILICTALLSGCAPNLNTGNLSVTPRLAAESLHAGASSRKDAYRALGPPNSISYTEQTPWQYQSQRYLYPTGTREIWSYFMATVDGMEPLNPAHITNYRQVVRVYFDEDGVVTSWDVRPLRN